uniref:Macaca fascicularis brain cDNA clone: QflA-16759, similar to human hypothetical protein FLJ11200 (FLJ11200), mRNA, RefSeq: NM_018359.1 n=1 Tax=Macaca fascicularis TaxID=9541 RepID=I7G556_MACFA|nr:unnamed protein product [Macaca fascicularis]
MDPSLVRSFLYSFLPSFSIYSTTFMPTACQACCRSLGPKMDKTRCMYSLSSHTSVGRQIFFKW